jgi:hypothetical protein
MQQSFTSAAVRPFPNQMAVARRRPPPASKKLFHRGEIPAEFFALLEKLFERYRPSNLSEAHAVADAVRAAWFYLRHWRTRETFETRLRRHKPDAANWTQAESESLEAFTEYHHRARRSLLRALKKIRHLRKARPACASSSRELLSLFMGLFDMEGFPYHFGS